MYGIKINDMEDGTGNPYLAQIPLTVSPFVSLPTATTLPYTYKSLPNTLPPAATGEDAADPKPKFVVSASGHAAHPDDIAASCTTLQAHLRTVRDEAEGQWAQWTERIAARELAEKRRVAPGWLDREQKLLEPTRRPTESVMDMQTGHNLAAPTLSQQRDAEGEALDRAFGGLSTR